MKRVLLYYLYGFLVLDMLMGFLLLYMGLQEALLINPGQLVRGTLLVLLTGMLIADAAKRLDVMNGFILLAVVYFMLHVVVTFVKNNPAGVWAVELNTISKYIFLLLLVYYINKHKNFFLAHADKIMLAGFGILTLNLFIGYFAGIGISTYGQDTTATKGLIYSGNAVSILSLVFFTYFFFNIDNGDKYKYLCAVAVFDIYIVGTKAIFIVPVVILLYLATRVRWTVFKTISVTALVIPVLVFAIMAITPMVNQIFQQRYVQMLEATGINVENTSGVSGNMEDALLTYRRIDYALTQLGHQLGDVDGLLLGYGEAGQQQFWDEKGRGYTFAAMDFIDFLFQYGLAGCLLFYSFIFYAFYAVMKRWQFTPLAAGFIFIFLYSFFGGYVIREATASTMFAFLIALNLPQQSYGNHVAEHYHK